MLLCFTSVFGQQANYQIFENINLSTEASVTNCFLQDEQGMIWIGSNKGLFSYNGYSVQSHPAPTNKAMHGFTADKSSMIPFYIWEQTMEC